MSTGLAPDIAALLNSSNRILGLPAIPSALIAKPPPLPNLSTPSRGAGKIPSVAAGAKFDGTGPVAVIAKNAARFGLDPAAVLAYALEESNAHYGAVGDNGTSFGPFQAHIGGAAGNRSPQAAAAWANSPQGLIQMMRMMANSGARGLKGDAAVRAIYAGFGKGTPAAIPRGLARYAEAQQIISGHQGESAPTVNVQGHQYVNPIPPGSVRNRTDQGVDFQAPVGSQIKAIGDAQVISVSSDPGGFGTMITYKLLSGPLKGKMVFVGHTTAIVKPGQRVRAGEAVSIAKYTPGSDGPPGWVEMGYASGPSLTQARARGETASGHADTLSGKQFLKLLRLLGLTY